ncbi:MAG: glycoside hydrolase family 97 protein [Massilibacteroides sp.]|nr:glycoside hydrolase family 97 protein [Massilibacteroides sp.]MDD3061381.1 glycoside hydrolase family 97 protein [Massilibacteroides sp.]MDD4115133.1 glycoside hydrolase family 97 protein [Massilibacteroides sp.]MDD4659472.1 glycoside hydrolase family 97 protein [Massilibacteroides sp.]
MKKSIGLFLILWSVFSLSAKEKHYLLLSPNGRLEVTVTLDDHLSYSVKHDGEKLLDKSQIALALDNQQAIVLGNDPQLQKQKRKQITENIVSPFYRFSSFTANYNELTLSFRGNYTVVFRAYDQGIAYRFQTSFKQPIVIKNEVSSFVFDQNYKTYAPYSTVPKDKDQFAMAFQNLYTEAGIGDLDAEKLAFLPLTIDYANGKKLTITESDLEDYPGMFLRGGQQKNKLEAVFASYPKKMDYRPWRHMTYVKKRENFIAKVEGTRTFPWRILAISADDREMPVNNLVYALASPNRIGNYSWVKGGKVAWDWWNNWGIYGVDFNAGINTETYKHYIDFAAENKIPYVVLDEGWYDPKVGDMLTVIPDINLDELVMYAKGKNVGLILWTVFNVLDEQLDAACKKYGEMGIRGFKVDFLDRDDQTAVEMVYRIAEAAAKHQLVLDLHGIYKPTGINRTFPHIINFEAVFGMEEMKWSKVDKDMMKYDVIMPYIRQIAGFLDYTPGAMRNGTKRDFKDIYNNPMSQGTRCHQLAAYIVHDSPLTMLADNPTIYRKEQECTDFIVSIPNTSIEETRILQGTLGDYIVTARRVGSEWYVGGMTDWTPREITLDFSFLAAGSYQVVLFKDGINADKTAVDYKKEKLIVKPETKIKINMAPGGGFALSIKPE